MAYKENYPSKLLEEAVDAISSLPGVGRRSALRLALHLLKQPQENVHHFTAAIDRLRAHPVAPSHISAIMSGVMIKMGVYGVMRLMQAIDHNTELLYTIGLIVLLSGIITGLWGVIFAAMQNDVKRLLAYSSIENIGVILIGLGIAAVGHAAGSDLIGMCGMCGALLHTVNHSLFKTMLFFGAGNIYSKMHTTTMNRMGGIAKHMPLTAALMAFAVAAICALPPLNGFVSELFIYIGMFNGISDGHEVLYSVAIKAL